MDVREYIFKRENPVVFDKEGKFVYFPVNKAMQSTLARNLLSDRCIIFKDNKQKWIKAFNETNFDEVYKFGITRHPVTKFESAFNYIKKQEKKSLKHKRGMRLSKISINKYVKKIVVNYNNPFELNPHFEKQYEGFYFNGKLIVDELFKIESKEEKNKMYEKIGICNNTTLHCNKTDHIEKLDDESIKIIEKIYSNDLIFYK